jgi:MoxR-like ATPase
MSDRYVRGHGNTWDNRLPRADGHLLSALQALDDDDGKLAVDPEAV